MSAKTTAETLVEAIKHEIEGREFYLALAKKVKNPLVRRKILGLAEDELEHRETLSRLYWAQTGREVGELESYVYHNSRDGHTVYGAPEGRHDDTVMALSLAWKAASRPRIAMAIVEI